MYSGEELASTLAGSWDIDGIETPGYRPVFTLLNHLRARWFGESLPAQRAFQLLLMAVFLCVLGLLLLELGMDRLTVACLILLLPACRVFTLHLIYFPQASQIVSGLCILSAALAALRFARTGQPGLEAWAVALLAPPLLIKEDSYAAAPLLLVLCALPAEGARRRLKAARRIVLAAFALVGLHALLRAFLIEGAPGWRGLESIRGYLYQLRLSVLNFGDVSFPSAVVDGVQTSAGLSRHVLSTHAFALGGVLALFFVGGRPSAKALTARLAAAGFVLALPGLAAARPDLVLLPTVFFLAAFLTAFREVFFVHPRSRLPAALATVYLLAAAGGLWRSRRLADDYSPDSVNAVLTRIDFAFGSRSFAPMPEERRHKLLEDLRRRRIRTFQDGRALMKDVEANWESYAAGRGRKGAVFIPPFAYLSP